MDMTFNSYQCIFLLTPKVTDVTSIFTLNAHRQTATALEVYVKLSACGVFIQVERELEREEKRII